MSHDMGAPAKKSKLPLILGILGGGFLLCVACCGGCMYLGWSQVSAPLDAAVAGMENNAEFVEKLGTPIEYELNGLQMKDMTNVNGEGGAEFSFNVKGPNGSASVDADLNLSAGNWSVESLTGDCSDGTTITIP